MRRTLRRRIAHVSLAAFAALAGAGCGTDDADLSSGVDVEQAVDDQAAADGGEVTADIDTDSGEVTAETDDGTLTFGGEDLPEGFPSQMPIYPGGQQAAGLTQDQDGVETIVLGFTFGLFDETQRVDAQDVLDFYLEELPAAGWTLGEDANAELANDFKLLDIEGHGFTGSVHIAEVSDVVNLSISLERPSS